MIVVHNRRFILINHCRHFPVSGMEKLLWGYDRSKIVHPLGLVFKSVCPEKGNQLRFVVLANGQAMMFNKKEWFNKCNPFNAENKISVSRAVKREWKKVLAVLKQLERDLLPSF